MIYLFKHIIQITVFCLVGNRNASQTIVTPAGFFRRKPMSHYELFVPTAYSFTEKITHCSPGAAFCAPVQQIVSCFRFILILRYFLLRHGENLG